MSRMSCFLTAFLALFLGSCIYEVPFVETASVKIDKELTGAWDEKVEEGKTPQRIVVLPFSETEYLSHYPADEGGIYYRGYLIELGGERYVQLKALGTHKGLSKDLHAPYTLASFSREGDSLPLRMMDQKVIDPNIKDSALLREAFLKHKDHKNLFDDVGVFVRSAAGNERIVK
jgi:hypothetical protein